MLRILIVKDEFGYKSAVKIAGKNTPPIGAQHPFPSFKSDCVIWDSGNVRGWKNVMDKIPAGHGEYHQMIDGLYNMLHQN